MIPDILDTYLLDGVIRSSIAAVDLLISVLPMERRASKVNEVAEPKPTITPRNSSRKRQEQIVTLCMYLRAYHEPEQPWIDTTHTVIEKLPFQPLNATQWATILKWKHRNGGLADSTVRRVMEDIFGQNPMQKYQQLLAAGDRNKTFSNFIKRMLELKGGSYYGEITEENPAKTSREISTDPSKIDFIQEGTNLSQKSKRIEMLKQKDE